MTDYYGNTLSPGDTVLYVHKAYGRSKAADFREGVITRITKCSVFIGDYRAIPVLCVRADKINKEQDVSLEF